MTLASGSWRSDLPKKQDNDDCPKKQKTCVHGLDFIHTVKNGFLVDSTRDKMTAKADEDQISTTQNHLK